MKILVAYGTTEGQTRKISEFVVQRLRDRGNEVQLYDTARRPRDLGFGGFDAVVIAASVHQMQHQAPVINFVRAHLDQLRGKPTLFLSVSLSAAFDAGRAGAEEHVDQFVATTGWQPAQTRLVAGAVRYSEYDYFKQQIIEHVVLKEAMPAGPKGDYEFTDWADLARTVEAFAQSLET